MENSSKALLMAGGILMGILLLSGLAFAWGRISNTQARLDDPEKESQIAEFNKQFSSYEGETIYGADVISLINKINSVNKDVPDIFNSKVQYEEIKLKVTIKNDYSELGLNAKTYGDIIGDVPKFSEIKLNAFLDLEKRIGKDNLTRLSSLHGSNEWDNLVAQEKNERNAYIKILGNSVANKIQSTDTSLIADYWVYMEFKTSKFTCKSVDYNNRGQINLIEVEEKD